MPYKVYKAPCTLSKNLSYFSPCEVCKLFARHWVKVDFVKSLKSAQRKVSQTENPQTQWKLSSGPSTRPWETSECKVRLISFPATQTRAWLPFVCTPAWRGAPPRPSRLPAAEVTVSPRRSHSPGSMNPDQAREHRAWRVAACDRKRVVRLGAAFESCRCLSCASRLRVTWLRRSRTFRARCPSLRRAGRLWLGLFWLPHHPLCLPAPPRGLELPRRAFEPGTQGGRFPSTGGSRPEAHLPQAHPGLERDGDAALPVGGWGRVKLEQLLEGHPLPVRTLLTYT